MAYYDGAFSGRPVLLRLHMGQNWTNTEGNYSNISWILEVVKNGNTTAWASDPSNWQANIAGVTYSGTWSYNMGNLGIGQGVIIAQGGFNVSHNADGTYNLSGSAAAQDLHGYLGNANTSGIMGLTPIPRATTPTFTNPMTINSAYTINLPRASSSFTHTVQYFFGSTSGTIGTGLGTSVSWTPPLSLLTQIPNAASGTGFIRVITYNGGTNIGQRDVSLTLSAPASAVPDFTTITHSEGVAGVAANIGGYVQAISKLTMAITGAVGYQGSTIASYKIEVAGQTVNAVSGTTPAPIATSGTVVITGTVTDTRGRTKVKTVNVTVLAYAPPTITAISAIRSNGAGVPDEEGAYLRVNINAAVQSLIVSTQRNALNYRIYTREYGILTWTLKDTTTPGGITFNGAEAIGTYSIETAYDVLVEVYDDFSTSAFQLTIPTAAIFQHWDGRDGVGIGKYRQYGMLDVLGEIFQNNGKKVVDEFSLVNLLAAYSKSGTTAERDAVWGVPANATARVALAEERPRWFNTDKGWDEQYFAQYDDAGATVYNSAGTHGWKVLGRPLLHPTAVVAVGGTASDHGQFIRVNSGVTGVLLQGIVTPDFEDYEIIMRLTDNADNTSVFFRTANGTVQDTTSVGYGSNWVKWLASGSMVQGYTVDNFAVIAEVSTTGSVIQGRVFNPGDAGQRTQWEFTSQNSTLGNQLRTTGHQGFLAGADGIWFGLSTFASARIQVFGIGR